LSWEAAWEAQPGGLEQEWQRGMSSLKAMMRLNWQSVLTSSSF
jgi:hypothetical protein